MQIDPAGSLRDPQSVHGPAPRSPLHPQSGSATPGLLVTQADKYRVLAPGAGYSIVALGIEHYNCEGHVCPTPAPIVKWQVQGVCGISSRPLCDDYCIYVPCSRVLTTLSVSHTTLTATAAGDYYSSRRRSGCPNTRGIFSCLCSACASPQIPPSSGHRARRPPYGRARVLAARAA